jgi:DNA primase
MAMWRIAPERLRRLRDDVCVLSVIDDLRLELRVRGSRLRFCCPQCDHFETRVNRERNLGHCFRCRRGFNTIDIVMAARDWSFLNAIDYLERLRLTIG